MGEDYIQRTLGNYGLPLYCASEFWIIKCLFANIISNNNPLKNSKKVYIYISFLFTRIVINFQYIFSPVILVKLHLFLILINGLITNPFLQKEYQEERR